jgi:site-specific DNA-methyltransferase (adenine-specific)
MTKTSSFGVSKRENHDATRFYARNVYDEYSSYEPRLPEVPDPEDWANALMCSDAAHIDIPRESIALTFTSPPYNVGKEYEEDMTKDEYAEFLYNIGLELYDVTIPGGRFVFNTANIGRKPYIPLTKLAYEIFADTIGFLPAGEIIWVKGKGASGSCAWGSWNSAKAPRLRDLHEYLLVFCKENYSRYDKGTSTMEKEEFMESTLSTWYIAPESAKKVGHPAPFPLELAKKVINLFSYKGDVILDPFVGSGTTCIAAKQLERYYVGVDYTQEYIDLAQKRIDTLA